MKFGTWNVMNFCRAGSLTAAARELAGYKLDLVSVQEVRWDKGGTWHLFYIMWIQELLTLKLTELTIWFCLDIRNFELYNMASNPSLLNFTNLRFLRHDVNPRVLNLYRHLNFLDNMTVFSQFQ